MKSAEQQQAYNLYFQTEFTQGEIAHLLNISRKTVGLWVKENHWDKLKKSSRHIPAYVAEQCYYMLVNKTAHILGRSDCYPSDAEVNSIRKLSLTIKQLKNRQTTSESMETLVTLMDVIKAKDPALAQQLMPYIDTQMQKRVSIDYQENYVDQGTYLEGQKLNHKEQAAEDYEEYYNEAIAMQLKWAEEHKEELQNVSEAELKEKYKPRSKDDPDYDPEVDPYLPYAQHLQKCTTTDPIQNDSNTPSPTIPKPPDIFP